MINIHKERQVDITQKIKLLPVIRPLDRLKVLRENKVLSILIGVKDKV